MCCARALPCERDPAAAKQTHVLQPNATQASAAVPCGFLLFVVAWVSALEAVHTKSCIRYEDVSAAEGRGKACCSTSTGRNCNSSAHHTSLQVIIIVVAFGFPFAPGYSQAAVGAFSAMPWALLAKGVQDLADASQGGARGGLHFRAAPAS